MAKSNTERQAAFRARKVRDSRPVQLWLEDADKLARSVSRLSALGGISQAEVVARLVQQTDKEVMDGMDDEQFEKYLA